jgi:ribosomal protein L37AE/L43A
MSEQHIQIICPSCKKDIEQKELDIGKCNICDAELKAPIQNATVTVDPLPMFGITF